MVVAMTAALSANAQVAGIQAPKELLDAPFTRTDEANFAAPQKVFYPETWFHFIGDNVSKEGIDADLEAIAAAGISGVQWFHGAFGGRWPGVETPIVPLSKEWDEMVAYVGEKARSLGLRLTIQTCPGWAMAGGPWIKPEDAMRDLVWSRTDIPAGSRAGILPKGQPSDEDWRDYEDVCVLAFPTPLGDSGKTLEITDAVSDEPEWANLINGGKEISVKGGTTHKVSFTLPEGAVVRTLELPALGSFTHNFVYTPDLHFRLDAISAKGERETVLDMDMPMGSWQDNQPMSLAVNEADACRMELTVTNAHDISVQYIRFSTAARKNEWQAESGGTLRAKERFQEHTRQRKEAFVQQADIKDLTALMSADGRLDWTAPRGKGTWTILRFGHVNAGRRNGPAPENATGWECNKLDKRGADAQFSNYVGRLQEGPLQGKANGMLMDSWECNNQTWTGRMEEEFATRTGYGLRSWIPALAGYVVDDQETTTKFLTDWRRVKTALYNENFFKRMTDLAHSKGLEVQYETAGSDVVSMDPIEFFKYADVPMTEFWHPISSGYVGDLNFKPIKPTASAAHIYGKRRVAAESFTSFDLNWDEHWEMLREVANLNMTEGVTHNVFHTYTHNPQVGFLPPGTSFGSGIGTPFLRGQTWWPYMKEFTTYLARTGYLLERGKPVVDVLWYLGDEVGHKPDQRAPFPAGFKYDYCNPDVLLHRLSVKDGQLVTPDGQSYGILWIPENGRMLPQTLEKIRDLAKAGAMIIAAPPRGIATLSGGEDRYEALVKEIWGKKPLVKDITIEEALAALPPRIKGGDVMWMQREADSATWFYVTAPVGGEFHGELSFKADGTPEIWDCVSGTVQGVEATRDGDYQTIRLDLCHAQSCFVVFRQGGSSARIPARTALAQSTEINSWTLSFPQGWGAPECIELKALVPWKDLPISKEGKAFSGTATYRTVVNVPKVRGKAVLDLGRVDFIADVKVNGKRAAVLWTSPYRADITALLHPGENTIEIDVTSTWFNRLAYDASQPEEARKTWTIAGPKAGSPLRESGLIGPVCLEFLE